MSEDFQYLVDNNVLTKLSKDQRASAFFRSQCHIPSEVLYEARGFPDFDALSDREYHTSPGVLRQLVRVIETVAPTDTDLVDLYANQGNADPIIVACALDARYWVEYTLMPPTWSIVSDDGAVRARSAHFGIPVLTGVELKTLIDQ